MHINAERKWRNSPVFVPRIVVVQVHKEAYISLSKHRVGNFLYTRHSH